MRWSAPVAVLRTLPAWTLPATLAALAAVGFFLLTERGHATQPGGLKPPSVSGHIQDPSLDLKPGVVPPDFQGTTFSGQPLRLSSLKGHAVLVNFFASWCVECRAELPAIQSAYTAYRAQGFDLV